MKKNVGSTDQFLRFLIAFVALSLYFADVINLWFALLLLVVLMVTALFNFCPLYNFLGINTRKNKTRK